MKTETPQISWHNRDPILSVDIQQKPLPIIPSSTSNTSDTRSKIISSYRMATSGNDRHVVIWRADITSRMISRKDCLGLVEKTSVEIKALADLTRHERSVNVVRFAPMSHQVNTLMTGTAGGDAETQKTTLTTDSCPDLLAAGDDNWVIIIWKLNKPEEIESVPQTSPAKAEEKMEVDCDSNEVTILKDVNKDKDETPMPSTSSGNAGTNEPIWNPDGDEPDIDLEKWTQHRTLRGHVNDVCDLSWSPDGTQLISGSIDNTAIVWDVQKATKLHIFNDHRSFVLGVSWDPLSNFWITLSADRNLRVFNTHNKRVLHRVYKMEVPSNEEEKCVGSQDGSKDGSNGTKVTRLFYDDTLMHRRMTFTPGGEFLIVPAGILELFGGEKEKKKKSEVEEKKKEIEKKTEMEVEKKEESKSDEMEVMEIQVNQVEKKKEVVYQEFINTTYVFDRRSMNKPIFHLPSSECSIAVRSCPQLFKLQDDLENPFQFPYRIVFAVATENSVQFYDSQQSIPFAQVSNIHYTRLTDIAWSPDGRLLMITSSDGYGTFVTFNAEELGVPYDGPKYDYIAEAAEIARKKAEKVAAEKAKLKAAAEIAALEAQQQQLSCSSQAQVASPNTSFTKVKGDIPVGVAQTALTPEIEKQTKKLSDIKMVNTPSIKSFFKKKEPGSNNQSVTPNRKPTTVTTSTTPSAAQQPISSGIKRKEEMIDLTDDSDLLCASPNVSKTYFSSSKKINLMSAKQTTQNKQVSDKDEGQDIASSHLLTVPANSNCKVKDKSVRKLTDIFKSMSRGNDGVVKEKELIKEKQEPETKAKITNDVSPDLNARVSTVVVDVEMMELQVNPDDLYMENEGEYSEPNSIENNDVEALNEKSPEKRKSSPVKDVVKNDCFKQTDLEDENKKKEVKPARRIPLITLPRK